MLGLDRRELAAIFIGGALGTSVRAVIGTVFTADPTAWPWPTFAVNIVGAFLLGYFTTRLLERLPLSSYRRPLLATFSTMQVETVKMLDHHAFGLALGYTCASVLSGLAAVYLATALVRRTRVTA